mmetsp:Transcript_147702/g.472592  ORF Transcript_147702/g.472592 Transcript_147702/m.472592 type:complete len:1461 (+) Transcript_147702:97-4479(+)
MAIGGQSASGRWDAVLPYLPPSRGIACSPNGESSLRKPAVGSPRSDDGGAFSSSSDDGGGSDCVGGAGGQRRLPNIEDIYDLTTNDLAAFEEQLAAKMASAAGASSKEERLHQLIRVELSERRGVEQIGLALVGGRFDLSRAIAENAAKAQGAAAPTPAKPPSPRRGAMSRSPEHAAANSAARFGEAQAQVWPLDAPSPSSSSRAPAPDGRAASPMHRPRDGGHAAVPRPLQVPASPSALPLVSSPASRPLGGVGPTAGFKPTPVAFDFVIGSSSVKRKPPPKKKKKKPPEEEEEAPAKGKTRDDKGARKEIIGRPPPAPGRCTAASQPPPLKAGTTREPAPPRASPTREPSQRRATEDRRAVEEDPAQKRRPHCSNSEVSGRGGGIGTVVAKRAGSVDAVGAGARRSGAPSPSAGRAVSPTRGAGSGAASPSVGPSPGASPNAGAAPRAVLGAAGTPCGAHSIQEQADSIVEAISVALCAPSSGGAVGGASEDRPKSAGGGVALDALAEREVEDGSEGIASGQAEQVLTACVGNSDEDAAPCQATCSNCGTELMANARFCSMCGQPREVRPVAEGACRLASSREVGLAADLGGQASPRSEGRPASEEPPGSEADPEEAEANPHDDDGDQDAEGEAEDDDGDERLGSIAGGSAAKSSELSECTGTGAESIATSRPASSASRPASAGSRPSSAATRPSSGAGRESSCSTPRKAPSDFGGDDGSIDGRPDSAAERLLDATLSARSSGSAGEAATGLAPAPAGDRAVSAPFGAVRTGAGGRAAGTSKGSAAAVFAAAAAAGAPAPGSSEGRRERGAGGTRSREGGERPARRPPLPHDSLKAKEGPRNRTTELDMMGLDPKLLERGEIRSYGDWFPSMASIFTWGVQATAETSQHKDRYMREAMQVFQTFCDIIGSLEHQFKHELAPVDQGPNVAQSAMHAVNSRCAGLYGVFMRGIIDKISEPTEEKVPRPLSQQNVFGVKYYKVVQNRTEVYDIVTRVFHRMDGWEELPHGMGLSNVWNLCWTWSKPKLDYSRLCTWQKVNHFPENRHLTRKDCLKRTIDRYTRTGGKFAQYFNICPKTFVLPKEYTMFIESFAQIDEENEEAAEAAAKAAVSGGGTGGPSSGSLAELPGGTYPSWRQAAGGGEGGTAGKAKSKKAPNLWIMKPAGSSRGRGIQVVNDVGSVHYGELTVIQQYISNPFLLGGYKWDMRVYVTVTSFNPLEAFLYQDGFARFTTVPYSNDPEDVDNKFVHLTNSSIQRHSEDSMHTSGNCDAESRARAKEALLGGTKINFPMLRNRLKAVGVDWDMMWAKMIDCILKSLVMGEDHIPNQANSFELFGYDLMLDTRMKVWLIEVNSSPSMGQEHLLDEQVKQPLIGDTIDLVDPVAFDRRRLAEALQRRCERKAASGAAGSRQQLDIDLHSILSGEAPRKFGDMPKRLGKYERIAPGEAYDSVAKMRSALFNRQ